jgi:hypothetical protein
LSAKLPELKSVTKWTPVWKINDKITTNKIQSNSVYITITIKLLQQETVEAYRVVRC